ncbi:MAG: hypothetical protein FWD78_11850 [Treponema sp.]|nr:hypothetical protein [Treponema sp.]
MGQIFNACAYDLEAKTCCVYFCDKFHSDCYSFSGAVKTMHYLLREKPCHIMWAGDDILSEDSIGKISNQEYLLGISVFADSKDFYDDSVTENSESARKEKFWDKVKFIDENNKLWKRMNQSKVLDDAEKYFDWNYTCSVKYSGYLVNHTKKLAVDLSDYYDKSKFMTQDGIMAAVDLLPLLTETGGGTQMALFNGISTESTEQLSGAWRCDVLQIAEELPANYNVINCCFSEIRSKTEYCYRTFGADKQGFVLCNSSGKRLEAAALNFYGKRASPRFVKVKLTDNKTSFEY